MRASTAKTLSLSLSLLVFVTGAAVLTGWFLHIPILTTWGPGLVTMKINTALGFVLAALSLILLLRESLGLPYVLGKILAAVVATIGLATLAQFLLGQNWGIDDWVMSAQISERNNPFPSRMSPITTLCFSFIGLSLLLLDLRKESPANPSEILAAS